MIITGIHLKNSLPLSAYQILLLPVLHFINPPERLWSGKIFVPGRCRNFLRQIPGIFVNMFQRASVADD